MNGCLILSAVQNYNLYASLLCITMCMQIVMIAMKHKWQLCKYFILSISQQDLCCLLWHT